MGEGLDEGSDFEEPKDEQIFSAEELRNRQPRKERQKHPRKDRAARKFALCLERTSTQRVWVEAIGRRIEHAKDKVLCRCGAVDFTGQPEVNISYKIGETHEVEDKQPTPQDEVVAPIPVGRLVLNTYKVITDPIEGAIRYGIMRAYKHSDKQLAPDEIENLVTQIEQSVTSSLSDVINFEATDRS